MEGMVRRQNFLEGNEEKHENICFIIASFLLEVQSSKLLIMKLL